MHKPWGSFTCPWLVRMVCEDGSLACAFLSRSGGTTDQGNGRPTSHGVARSVRSWSRMVLADAVQAVYRDDSLVMESVHVR